MAVWALVGAVLVVLWLIGRALAREFALPRPQGRRLPWVAGAMAAFISCTMAAALVRVEAPVQAFAGLGLLMVMAVTSLRLAYHRAKSPDASHK